MKQVYSFRFLIVLLFYCFVTPKYLLAGLISFEPNQTIDVFVDKTNICVGENIMISLVSSELGVEYQLKADGIAIDEPVSGTGSQLDFYTSPAKTTTYSFTATNTSTLESVDILKTVSINVNPGPNLDLPLTADKYQICEESNEPVLISLDNSEVGLTYLLKDEFGVEYGSLPGNGSKINFTSVSPNRTTSYLVETTSAGCNGNVEIKNRLSIDVINLPLSNINLSISEPNICIGEKTTITLDTSEIGVSYHLYDGTYYSKDSIVGNGSSVSFPEFSPFRSVNYQVKATNLACGSSRFLTNTIRVNVGLQPEEHLHPTINKHTICEGEEVIISLTPTDTKVSYQLWEGNNAIGNPIIGNNQEISFAPTIPSKSATFRIEALGDKCLSPIEIRYTVDVDVHHYPQSNKIITSDKDTVCLGEEINLSVENSESGIIYSLHDGNSLIESNLFGNGNTIHFPAQYPKKSTTYTVYAHETVCTTPMQLDHTKSVVIPDITPNSIESFATPTEFCEGEEIDIELPSTIQGIKYILWDGDELLSELTGNGADLIFENIVPKLSSNIEITIGNCQNRLVAAKPSYQVQSNPQLDIITSDIQNGYDGRLVISVNHGLAPYTYIINPGETITKESKVLELINLEEGTYQILVVDGNACRSSEAGQLAQIEINNKQKVIVDNALTPNGDGINDKWIIHYDPLMGNPEVFVFNIYGQQVYHSKSYQNNWKGNYNGSILPNGAYYYLIDFNSTDIKPIKGSLSILGN